MLHKILISLFYRFPFLTKKILRGKGFVFMLHRVLPAEERGYEWNKSLAISPEALEKWVSFFKQKGFDVVSMDEVYRRVRSKKSKPFVAFTMDDGYKDNLTYGLPILEKLNIPCTIYVANCFPNNQAIYWWYFLEEYINENSKIDLTPLGISYSSHISDENKKSVYDEVRELLRKSTYAVHKKFALEICGIQDLNALNNRFNLTWEEVQQLSEHSLITIGGHTKSHVSLANQTKESANTEIQLGTEELEKKLSQSIRHFAYPYGSLDDVSNSLFDPLAQSGYQTAVLNHPGSIFYDGSNHLFQIPRMGLSDETSRERLSELMEGKLHLNFNGVKKRIISG